MFSASFLAELSVSSPRNYLFLLSKKIFFLDQSIQKIFYLILKKEALPMFVEKTSCYNIDADEALRTAAVLPFSKLNEMFFGCFDPVFWLKIKKNVLFGVT